MSTATVAYDKTNEEYILCWDWGMSNGIVRDDNYVHYIPQDRWESFKEALNTENPEINYLYLSQDTEAWLEGYAYEMQKGKYECGTLLDCSRWLFEQSNEELYLVDSSEYIK